MSQSTSSPDGTLLNISYSWSKSKILILDSKTREKVLVTKCEFLGAGPKFLTPDEKEVIGTSKIHAVGISPDLELRGRHFQLKATKRLKTKYEFPSEAFAADSKGQTTLQWTADMGMRHWNFVCLDENSEAVARMAVDMYAVRKIATLEFVAAVQSEAAREEIIVTGVTLLYEEAIRTFSLPKVFGAAFGKIGPGKEKGKNGKDLASAAEAMESSESDG